MHIPGTTTQRFRLYILQRKRAVTGSRQWVLRGSTMVCKMGQEVINTTLTTLSNIVVK